MPSPAEAICRVCHGDLFATRYGWLHVHSDDETGLALHVGVPMSDFERASYETEIIAVRKPLPLLYQGSAYGLFSPTHHHPPASELVHMHGFCPGCRALRASADIRDGAVFCTRCGTELLEATLHEPHGPIEDVHVGVPE